MKILTISDLHLLVKALPLSHMLASLDRVLTRTRLSTLDAIFITGDVFDHLNTALDIINASGDELDLMCWIESFLKLAKETKTAIRIVKGTPLHDWDQSKLFVRINEIAKIGADLKYIDDVHVEYDTSLKLWIGYVPDAIRPTTEQVYTELVEKMATLGCAKLHYILAHGFCDFQNTHGAPAYDTSKFSDLVEYAMFCGHDHTAKQSQKVWVPGSFERWVYNDETPKGGLCSTVVNGVHYVTFVENTNAAWVYTKDLTDIPDDLLTERVEAEIVNHRPEREGYLGKLRLRVNHATLLKPSLERIAKRCKFKLDIEYINDTEYTELVTATKFDDNVVPLTKENIRSQLLEDVDVDLEMANRLIDRVQKDIKP